MIYIYIYIQILTVIRIVAVSTIEQRSKPLGKGLYLGLKWVIPAKAKTQLAKAGREVGDKWTGTVAEAVQK